jgi:hypothetical protein
MTLLVLDGMSWPFQAGDGSATWCRNVSLIRGARLTQRGDHGLVAWASLRKHPSLTTSLWLEEMPMLPLSEKVLVRLPKDLAAALDR